MQDLPLYLLKACDCRGDAQLVSCDQDIAAHGAFAAAMLSFLPARLERGAYHYRQVPFGVWSNDVMNLCEQAYWECGMIGHVLYLECTLLLRARLQLCL